MSNNSYGYTYSANAPSYSLDPNQQWANWALQQQQRSEAYKRAATTAQYHSSPLSRGPSQTSDHASRTVATGQYHGSLLGHLPSQSTAHALRTGAAYYQNASNRLYQQARRYTTTTTPPPLFANSSSTQQPQHSQQQPWQQRNSLYKRPRTQDSPAGESSEKSKTPKKRKKPLSQNIPSKRDWTLEEAEEALNTEKEYNKRFKNHSLIIKFPDPELNREIVSKLHSAIENVHFQQPSTPRFCFVTLQESVDTDQIISELNKVKFGEGYLTAEYKRDREDDQNIKPEDIDPCTLYVGNLAQEVTKDDIVKTYPKGRRIDIGYAKKMKYTRLNEQLICIPNTEYYHIPHSILPLDAAEFMYAFVSFKNATDSIEAFKTTHSTQMYSKSLIVRFRRLHGTVGLPGVPKSNTPTKKTDQAPPNHTGTPYPQTSSEDRLSVCDSDASAIADELSSLIRIPEFPPLPPPEPPELNVRPPPPPPDYPPPDSPSSDLHLGVVKTEVYTSDEEVEEEIITKPVVPRQTPFIPGCLEEALAQHRPLLIKSEIKLEPHDLIDLVRKTDTVKQEKYVIKEEYHKEEESSDDDDDVSAGLGEVDFKSLLNQLDMRTSQIHTLRKSLP